MKKNKSVNKIVHTTTAPNNINHLMNSPNFGKQQIILQSCCFFDYEKSHTPHASHLNVKYFDDKNNKNNKKKYDSTRISFSKNYKNIYLQTKMNLDKIKSKIDGINNNNNECASSIEKLKNENKALKDTINNLVLQLDKVFHIAEAAKNNELNIIEMNKNNKQEIKDMQSRINTLTIENEELIKQIKDYDVNSKNAETIYKLDQLKKIKSNDYDANLCKSQILMNKNKTKRRISDSNFYNFKKGRKSRNKTDNNEEIRDYQYKINEEENTSLEYYNEIEQQMQYLSQENYNLMQDDQKRVFLQEQQKIELYHY